MFLTAVFFAVEIAFISLHLPFILDDLEKKDAKQPEEVVEMCRNHWSARARSRTLLSPLTPASSPSPLTPILTPSLAQVRPVSVRLASRSQLEADLRRARRRLEALRRARCPSELPLVG